MVSLWHRLKIKALPFLLTLLILCQFSHGDHQGKTEILSFDVTTITYSDDNIATSLFNDNNLYTGVTMTSDMGQRISIDWTFYQTDYLIKGVFIHVKEQNGMSG